jgi:iron complex outermembrane receptor protein
MTLDWRKSSQEFFMNRSIVLACFCAGVFPAGLAHAQATANAITGANDAFGFKRGDEAIGIYDEASARGFNLESAGNYRFHGTYFVKNSGVSSSFLESTSVRIGYNTLPVTLPSPSGVIDYKLRDPAADEPSLATIGLDVFTQPYAETLFKHRSPTRPISGTLGVSFVPQMKDAQGGSAGGSLLIGGTARYYPGNFDVQIFGGEYRYERPSQFRLLTDGRFLNGRMSRQRFIGVDGLNDQGQRRIAGLLADLALSKEFGIGATTVFSQEDPTRSYLTLFGDLAADGTVDAKIIATPSQRTTSLSSELRAYWTTNYGDGQTHRVDLVGRLRSTKSKFGGATVHQLGRVAFDERLTGQSSDFFPGGSADLRDDISQVGAGLAYRAVIGRVRLNVGALKTFYDKQVSGASIAENRLKTSDWLYNLSAAYELGRSIEIYAGYSRGPEEAGVAPASAPNRYEVLAPATARQLEAAVIVRPVPEMKVVLGAFDLQRGYFGTEGPGQPYAKLGQVRHRGVELSAAGSPLKGLTVILGGVWLDPTVSVDFADGADEFRPIGVPRIRLLASADYRLTGKLHADAAVQYTGSRQATHDVAGQSVRVPSSVTVNAGLRTPLRLGSVNSTVRLQVLNLLNNFTWETSPAGTMTYSPSRRLRLVLTSEI